MKVKEFIDCKEDDYIRTDFSGLSIYNKTYLLNEIQEIIIKHLSIDGNTVEGAKYQVESFIDNLEPNSLKLQKKSEKLFKGMGFKI